MTDTPKRLRFDRFAGEKLPAGAKFVTRPSRWGNPFKVTEKTPAGHLVAVAQHRQMLREHPELVAEIRATLAGFDLACTCPLDWPCHADTLLFVAAGGTP